MTSWEHHWWAGQDSNLQPIGYEPTALTIELPARQVAVDIIRPNVRLDGAAGYSARESL